MKEEFARQKRETEVKRIAEETEARFKRQVEEEEEKRKERDDAIRKKIEVAAAEKAAKERVLNEARHRVALQKEAE